MNIMGGTSGFGLAYGSLKLNTDDYELAANMLEVLALTEDLHDNPVVSMDEKVALISCGNSPSATYMFYPATTADEDVVAGCMEFWTDVEAMKATA